MKNKIVGVLGGMGPHASNKFMDLIYSHKKLKKDHLYPRIILDSNTKIPSRSRALIYNEKSPLNEMIKSANKLYQFGVNAIAIPCNTAHIWIDILQKKVKIPIFNITEVVSKKILYEQSEKLNDVYVFGTKFVISKKLYQKKFAYKNNFKFIKIKQQIQKKINNLIYAIKENNFDNRLNKNFKSIINSLKLDKKKNNIIILACTELSFFKNLKFKNIMIVDSSSVLAECVFNYCNNNYDFFENSDIENFWNKRSSYLKKKKLGLLQSTMLTNSERSAQKKDELEKKNVIRKIKKYLKNKNILEAGFGTGRWTQKFIDFAKNIDAYEKNPSLCKFVEKKLKKYKNLKIFNKSVTDIKIKKYDVIISIALLHYLNDKEFKKFIEIIKNCSKKNSIIIFRETFSFEYDFEIFKFYSEILKSNYSAHYRSLENVINKLGKKFILVNEKKIFNPELKKPETYQNLAIFKKIN